MELSFDKLPQAISELFTKVENIERLLQSNPLAYKEEDQLLNIGETAKLLNLSVPTIYGMVRRCEIPVCKKSKRLYFTKSDIMAWVKSGRKLTMHEVITDTSNNLKTPKKH